MQCDRDLAKAGRQHLEMEQSFAGFVPRCTGRSTAGVAQNAVSDADDVDAELDRAGRTVGVAGGDERAEQLALIAAEVEACCRCGLGASRTHAVPGEGSPNARIMFIGEAPGADEDAQGRPFVGRAGQLLDKIIGACRLKRSDVFIANILKCRPPDNRDPRPEEIVNCLPVLQRQIEVIRPEVIVALGAHAARTLLNTNLPIGRLRGRFQDYINGLGQPPIKLIATYHPAYLLRNYTHETRAQVWDDMKKVLAELGLPVPDSTR